MEVREATWARVQEQAFTSWMDKTLKNAGEKQGVLDLRTDIQDGVGLIKFFEILSGKRCRERYNPNPQQRIQKIMNLSIGLAFLRRDMGFGGNAITCSPENIADAELREILGMLWILYRKYRMSVEGIAKKGMKEEDAILEWINSVTTDYGVDVKSFRNGFTDGLAFLALAHAYDRDNCNFNFDEVRSKPPKEILQTAFTYAQEHMDIQKLLDEEEVASGTLDERALSLYTSLFYHAYKAKAARDEAAQAQSGAENMAIKFQLEAKSKGELVSINLKLQEDLDERTQELENEKSAVRDLQAQMEELRAEIAARNADITGLKEELAQSRQSLAKAEHDKQDLLLRIQGLEEGTRRLTQEVEAAQQLHDDEKEHSTKLEKDVEESKKEISELKQRLAIETAAKEGGEQQLSARLAEETKKVTLLQQEKAKLEEEQDTAVTEIKELKGRVKREAKVVSSHEKQLEECRQQTKVNTGGLAMLRTNLERHITDIHRWQKFLEGSAADVADPDPLASMDKDELEKKTFMEQLTTVGSLLDEENIRMTRILAQRQASAASAPTGEKKDKKSKKEKEKKEHKHRDKGEDKSPRPEEEKSEEKKKEEKPEGQQ